MLNETLEYLNNYFFEYTSGNSATVKYKNYAYSKALTFTSADTIEGDFTDTFIVGEYIYIENSRLNDGVYLISAIDDTSITIDTTIDITVSTEAEVTCLITKCYIPKQLVSLIAEIKTYNTDSTTGVASESQGNRSVSYTDGSSEWQNAFKGRLSAYKKLRWC